MRRALWPTAQEAEDFGATEQAVYTFMVAANLVIEWADEFTVNQEKYEELRQEYRRMADFLNANNVQLRGAYVDDEMWLQLEDQSPYMIEWYEGKWVLFE